MALQKEIVISSADFVKGIQSPYIGISETRGLDVTEIPGIIKINGALTKVTNETSADGVQSLPFDIVSADVEDNGTAYMQTRDNKVWRRSGGTWILISTYTQGGTGAGLAYYAGFIFVFTRTSIDLIKCSDLAITIGFQTFTGDEIASFHPSVTAKDRTLYIGAGSTVVTVDETAGQTFDPSNSDTFTYSTGALILPDNEIIQSLREYGEKIYAGIEKSTGYDNIAKIYPWDRFSVDPNLPLEIKERGVKQMIVHDGLIFIVVGTRGSVYISNGIQIAFLNRIPEHLGELSQDGSATLRPNAIEVLNNRVLFGANVGNMTGVFGINRQGVITVEHITTADSSAGLGNIGVLHMDGQTLIAGWANADNDDFGLDELDGDNPYQNEIAYLISQFYRTGFTRVPATTEGIEVILARPLINNQSLKIQYRVNQNDSWTDIDTMSFVSSSEELENSRRAFDFGTTSQNLQFKALFDTPASVANNNIHLLEIRIK